MVMLMGRLPLPEVQPTQDDEAEIVCALEEQQFQALPIHQTDIKAATAKDPVLSQVYSFCARGWPTTSHSLNKKLIPFFNKRLQLTTQNGCLLWSLRVVIPSIYQKSKICYMRATQECLE